jgi:hypothetical protein
MATLFDLAQQYLNRALPETFRYGPRTPTTPPPVTVPPQDPNAPTARILPMPSGGGDGYSVYNPDPNRTRTSDQYSPYNYRQAAERNLIGTPGGSLTGTNIPNTSTEVAKLMDMYPDYYEGKQLTGIPGAAANYLKNSFIGKGLEYLGDKMPVNNRAILENELLGQGFQLNDIGQFVSDGGDAYKEDGSNIMAGYNAAKVTRQTFDKRRAKAKENMTPEGFEKFNKALTAAEDKFFGGSAKATTVFNDKLKQKDIDDGFINDQIPTYDQEINQSTYSEDDDGRFITDDSIIDNTIVGPEKGITSVYTPSPADLGYIAPNNSILANNNINRINDYINIGGGGGGRDPIQEAIDRDRNIISRGGGDNISYGGLDRNRGQQIDRGTSGAGDNNPVQTKTNPNTGLKISSYDTELEDDRDTGGGGNTGGGSKIVCTMMNESYGFGSFRNKIWLKHSKGLAPEYQKGYHKLFLPLVKMAKTNKVVRKILEHIAVHRTIDIRQESRGKVHLLGRVYRKILEPLCYFVGKHG